MIHMDKVNRWIALTLTIVNVVAVSVVLYVLLPKMTDLAATMQMMVKNDEYILNNQKKILENHDKLFEQEAQALRNHERLIIGEQDILKRLEESRKAADAIEVRVKQLEKP